MSKEITIPRIEIGKLTVTVKSKEGSSLIMNRFSERLGEGIKNTQLKKGKQARQAKDPDRDFKDSMHLTNDGCPGIPGIAFKKSMINAARYVDGLKMTNVRGAFFIMGDIVPLTNYSEPRARLNDFPIIPKTHGRDWRIRAEFETWEASIVIEYNTNHISPEQLINLLNIAGFHVGVLDWRPGANSPGNHGMFQVAIK